MNISDVNAISIVIFALLILIGGMMGFIKGKSKASLIAGVTSALLLLWCAKTMHNHSEKGILCALLVIALLEGIFIVRLIKTRKFMPSGLMLILCVIEQVFILWTSSHLNL